MKRLLAVILLLTGSTIHAEDTLEQFFVEVELPESIRRLPAKSISLSSALDEALAENLDLTVARADEQITKESRFVAEAALYPSLEVGLFARRLDGRVQGSFGLLADTAYSTYSTGTALVYRANIGARLEQALAERQRVQAAGLERLDTEQRVMLRVVESYQDLLLASVAVRITHDVVQGSEQFLRVVRARAEGGLTLGADVARSEAKLATDRQEHIRARNLLMSVSTRVAELLRHDVDTLLLPSDERLAPASFKAPAVPGLQARPDLQAAGRRANAAERLVSSAKWDLYAPELRLALGHLQIGDTPDDLEGRDERWALILWDLSPARFGQIRQRRAEEARARLRVAQLEDRAAGEIRRAEEDLSAARDRIPLAGEGRAAASDALRLSEARFKAGTAIALEVFDAQDVLAQARFNLARAIVEYNAAQARLLAATGTIERASFPPDATP